ncbi:MAG: exodeoxyribonuclease VII large subunit [Myxococcales bacterium]|jgi:exodeoxyribonuclease VII large subunit|nr:exodeoxyribonuclease VII large subunit [Myxococcales bacterium]
MGRADEERVIGVAELARRLRITLEGMSGTDWVEGEIGGFKRAPSGHCYFTLKDERADACIECVMYKFQATRARAVLSEGARVQLRGRATVYERRGRLQWVAEAARPAGRGALLEALERLKRQLAAEGLFDARRKRPLPPDPRVVGVVTSRSGAAVHDICTVALRRGRVRVVVSHATVQGEGAARSLLEALDRIEAYPGLDVIIIGRGGGSGEDLMAFNDERVVRRVSRCKVPVVSAVGHEIDTSLTDLVADRRAATPSEAAELVVPSLEERRQTIRGYQRHLRRAMVSRLHEERLRSERLGQRLSDPRFLIAARQQDLDELRGRLEAALRRSLAQRRTRLEQQHRRLALHHPQAVLARARGELTPLSGRLTAAMARVLDRCRARLGSGSAALQALSPLAILGRGYALATRAGGIPIRSVEELAPGERVEVRVRTGAFAAEVTSVLSTVENAGGLDHEWPAGARGESGELG